MSEQNSRAFSGRCNIHLHNGDCMEALRGFNDNSFELAIVDPPYGLGKRTTDGGSKRNTQTKFMEDIRRTNWDDSTPTKEYFNELIRISKNRIIFGANYFNCFDKNGGAIIWIKNQPMPNFSKAVIASCSFHKKIEVYNQTWTNFIHKGRTGIHPCEMPIDIFKWILKKYAGPGEKIIDTHAGSMSSRIACYDGGFDYWGWELDEDYFDVGCKRFENFKKQLKLFQ